MTAAAGKDVRSDQLHDLFDRISARDTVELSGVEAGRILLTLTEVLNINRSLLALVAKVITKEVHVDDLKKIDGGIDGAFETLTSVYERLARGAARHE